MIFRQGRGHVRWRRRSMFREQAFQQMLAGQIVARIARIANCVICSSRRVRVRSLRARRWQTATIASGLSLHVSSGIRGCATLMATPSAAACEGEEEQYTAKKITAKESRHPCRFVRRVGLFGFPSDGTIDFLELIGIFCPILTFCQHFFAAQMPR